MNYPKCPSCGNPEVNQFASGKFHCPYCGTAFASDGSICEKPVERPVEKPVMNETAVPQNAVQGNDGAGKSKRFKVLLGGVGALVVGAIVFAVVKGISTKSNTESPQSDITVAETAALFATGTENGHEYVDLGLPSGTKWATCNVGATKPEEFGDYYAWGETTTKETYNWETYKYGTYDYDGDYSKLTKYNPSDSKTTLDLSDDAAAANWGGKWRMPTYEQWHELNHECYWVWTSSYNNSNVVGYIVYKAKSSSDKGEYVRRGGTPSSSYSLNDAHVFLPAAGLRNNGVVSGVGYCSYYWSSSLDANNPVGAWDIIFNSAGADYYDCGEYRYCGLSVRAVCK